MRRTIGTSIATGLVALLFTTGSLEANAQGTSRTLTDLEWLTLPDFCRAALRGSGPQGQGGSTNTSHGIPGTHHFCIGMIFVNRAKTMSAGNQRSEVLSRALSEIDYSYSRMTRQAAMYSLVAAYRGMALYQQGKRSEAFAAWEEGIQIRPDARESYLAKAEVLLAEGRPQEALDVLLKLEAAKAFPAADTEYFLAHTYFELGRYREARIHADKAYTLGYPFPGIRKKLDRLGH